MTPQALEQNYSALANALERVGSEQAPLLLATLSLSLMNLIDDENAVSAAITQAERLTAGKIPPSPPA
jgi:hypothetical protein